ncbi:MAG: leucine-rich repeat protein, partial [Bacteroidales bacterium]|nr:leucine-rich repeat protein [Bacteroidales bacterium]
MKKIRSQQLSLERFVIAPSVSVADMPALLNSDSLYFGPALREFIAPGLKQLGDFALYNSAKLVTVELPQLTRIGKYAMAFCSSLSEIWLPSMEQVDMSAFMKCGLLTKVGMPKVGSIGVNVFDQTALCTLQLGKKAPSVIGRTFEGCPFPCVLQLIDDMGNQLTGANFNAAIASYGSVWQVFNITAAPTPIQVKINGGSPITAASLADAVGATPLSTINSIAVTSGDFSADNWVWLRQNAAELAQLVSFEVSTTGKVAAIPATVSGEPYFKAIQTFKASQCPSVGFRAFSGCISIMQVSMPQCITLDQMVFAECLRLHKVQMPALQHIGYRSFVHCGDLTAMELPALTSIEDAVFESSALTMLRLGDTPPSTVGDKSFAGCPAPRYLQANVVDAYRSYDDGMPGDDFWYGWRIGETPNNLVVSINGNAETIAPSLLAAIDNSGLLRSNITSIDIVGGDFTAAEWVALKGYMADLTGLQRFFIGDAVTVSDMPSTSIDRPYFGASLREISIPQLQVLGYYAFAKCSSLSVVSLPNLRHIYSSAFASCGMLDSLCLPRLEAIYGGFVFRNSGLARLYLGATPPTVSVGNAFSECSFPRYLYIVDDNGAEISGEALNAAQQAYRLTSGYDAAVEQWYGFNLDGAPLMQIMVNATMHRTGHTLAEALQGLDFGTIQSIEVTGGEFLVANWHYLRQQRNNLNQLSTFIISNGVSTVADMPALEISDGGYFASSLQRFEAHGLKNIGNYAFRSSQLATLKLPQASLLYNQAFYANNNLCMMQLGAKPPMLKYGVFYGYSSSQPRLLQLVDAQGEPLTRGELQTAREAYRADNGGNTYIWNGWILANTLTVKTSVTGSGIVALPFSIVLSDTLTNRQVLLQVTPNGGNRLKRISAHKADDASVLVPIDATSMSFVMPQHDVIVEAEFEAIKYTVEGLVNPAEGGTITGTGIYEEGATATLTATANAGYRFMRWSIAGSEVSTSNTYSFTVTGDASLTAEFEAIVTPNTYTVSATANPAEGGTITGTGTYEEGATATL